MKTHVLVESQTQDYLRDPQIQLILNRLIERLLTYFKTAAQLKQHLGNISALLRDQTASQTDYAAVNLLNLSSHILRSEALNRHLQTRLSKAGKMLAPQQLLERFSGW